MNEWDFKQSRILIIITYQVKILPFSFFSNFQNIKYSDTKKYFNNAPTFSKVTQVYVFPCNEKFQPN